MLRSTRARNHTSRTRFYDHFNMNGESYTFKKGSVPYAQHPNYMDKNHLRVSRKLKADTTREVAYFHHPPTPRRQHVSSTGLREWSADAPEIRRKRRFAARHFY